MTLYAKNPPKITRPSTKSARMTPPLRCPQRGQSCPRTCSTVVVPNSAGRACGTWWRLFKAAMLPVLVADRPSLNDVNKEQHDGDNQENVKDAAQRVGGHHSQKPQHKAQKHQCQQHASLRTGPDAEG